MPTSASPFAPSLKTKVVFMLLSSMMKPASGHGYVNSPRSRNIVAYLDGVSWTSNPLPNTPKKDTDPMSLNRGGLCGISPNLLNSTHYINYAHPPNYSGELMPANVQATYLQGDEVEFEVVLTAHHMGHIEYKACPLERNGDTPTQECFDSHPLTFVEDISYGLSADESHPGRLYVPPSSWMNSSGLPSGKVMKHKFKLPDNLNGNFVLIQWHYVTGNSCFDIGYHNYFGPDGPAPFSQPNLPDCTQPFDKCGTGQPEQVTITPSPGALPSPIPPAGPSSLGCASETVGGVEPPMPYPVPSPTSSPTVSLITAPTLGPTKNTMTTPMLSPTGSTTTVMTLGPTISTTTAPTLDQVVSTARCGIDFNDANSKCGAVCGGSDGFCTPPEGCFSGLSLDACPVQTSSPTKAPVSIISPTLFPSMATVTTTPPTLFPTEATVSTISPTSSPTEATVTTTFPTLSLPTAEPPLPPDDREGEPTISPAPSSAPVPPTMSPLKPPSACPVYSNTCGPGNPCTDGSCCSEWGYCGNTAGHCGECCQSNCWDDES